ncbi:MAG: imidazolonepropionase, partial [Defluviitaleaceae bacterium]|nr:imidazolonepropionase [Defluviitaleaceae bacterium]
MFDLVIKNAQLATAMGNTPKKGTEQKDVTISQNANIGIKDGKIACVCTDNCEGKQTIDAEGKLVTAGLVDAHTHLVFGGYRQHELELKLRGAEYLEILAAGGGILSTVKATREADADELYNKASDFLDQMMAHGTTTVEAKSGYGLEYETELKQLNVVAELQKSHKMDIVSTFMGAHAVPPEYKGNTEGFIDLLINDMIPKIAKTGLTEYCDIFCEKGVFDPEQSRRIMEAARSYGFKLKIHADEIVDLGGAKLAAEMGAVSAEHLIAASDQGLEALSKSETIAVLLPATSFNLNKPFARARNMVDFGIPVAIASDFNPGSSPNFNMQLAMTLGYLKYRLYPAEILTAVTLNAACAIGLGDTKGTVEVGKDADLVIWNCPDLDYLFYRFGNNQAGTVIKNGVAI